MFAVFAQASRPPAGFIDGQPTSASFTVPDVIFKRISGEDREHRPASVDLVSLNFTDSGGNGFIDANENISLRAVLRNYVTNLLNARRLREPRATLTTSTPNVAITQRSANLRDLNPGTSDTLFTGTPVPTELFSENFESAAPGALPTGWSSVHGAGA